MSSTWGNWAAEGVQYLGQAIGEDALWSADAQRPAGLCTGLDRAVTLVHGREGLRREGQEVAARVSERYAAAKAIEKRSAEFFFKRLDLRSDVGLHCVYFFGGAREVQLFSKGAKDLQLPHFHE